MHINYKSDSVFVPLPLKRGGGELSVLCCILKLGCDILSFRHDTSHFGLLYLPSSFRLSIHSGRPVSVTMGRQPGCRLRSSLTVSRYAYLIQSGICHSPLLASFVCKMPETLNKQKPARSLATITILCVEQP